MRTSRPVKGERVICPLNPLITIFPSAITASLAALLSDTAKIQSGQVPFLTRG
jgi:hypothetical protein